MTLDFGIIREGYCSDMTRTICPALTRERELPEAVLQAPSELQLSCGARCGDVDENLRVSLREAGI